MTAKRPSFIRVAGTMTQRIKGRLAKLETVIKAPSIQELSADERAVLTVLIFQRVLMPLLLRDAEAWQANGRPLATEAERVQNAARAGRLDGVFAAVIEANPRVNELIAQGRADTIVERLTAWGLWKEPDPPPPNAPTILERLERVFAHEADRKPAGKSGIETAGRDGRNNDCRGTR